MENYVKRRSTKKIGYVTSDRPEKSRDGSWKRTFNEEPINWMEWRPVVEN